MQMYMYANELAVERKKSPRDDVVSVLMAAEVDGEKLTEVEFDSFFLLLAVAGNETTRNLISGGMLALMQHPGERRRLLADPSLMPTAVEEMLRWVSPVIARGALPALGVCPSNHGERGERAGEREREAQRRPTRRA